MIGQKVLALVYFQLPWRTRNKVSFVYLFWFIGFVLSIASAARSFLYLETMNAWYKKKEEKRKKKKAWDLGSSRNPLSSFIHYTFNLKTLINYISTHQDPTVLYEPSHRPWWIGVKGLSYRNCHQEEEKWSVGDYRVPGASITRRREDCNRTVWTRGPQPTLGGPGAFRTSVDHAPTCSWCSHTYLYRVLKSI